MLKRKALLVAVLCSVFSLCPLLYGQANGSFSGTVADKTGSVISGATVKITSQGTGVTREVKTDDSGHYTAPFLPVSVYTIRVESQGFQITEQKDIRLQVDEQREVDFTVNPASVSTTVEVSATEVAVETTNPTLGQVITAEQVADLPLNGRDFVQLATLTPGVTQETNPNSFFTQGASSEVAARGSFSLSVGGSRAQSTDWLYDGVDNNELTAGGIGILPSIDAIQEFKVLTYNYSAEYGTRAGPTVLITTKSGSNKLHGTLFEFFRNTSLDAQSFFAVKKDKFNLNQFGGSLGGPIQKDKTFFFADYQATRRRRGIVFNGLIPTPAMVTGDYTLDPLGTLSRPNLFDGSKNANGFPDINSPYTFGPFQCDGSGNPLPAGPGGVQPAGVNCNKIPSNMFDPAVNPSVDPSGLAMLELYPKANNPNPSTLTNFSDVPTRKLNEASFDIRVDHNFSTRDAVFARFSYDQANSLVPGGSPGFAEQSAFGSTQNISNHGRNVAVSETHIFSPQNINQFNAGFNRIFNHILSFGDRSCEAAKIGILGANLNSACPNAPAGLVNQSTKDCLSCGMTSTLMNNQYWTLGDRGFAPFQGGTNVYSIADSFDMIRGKHDIRIGMGFRAQQMNVETNAFQDGFFINFGLTGDAAADVLLGQLGGGIHDQTFFGGTTGRRWKLFRPYVQDNWRVTKDLTLNLGLAWALVTPITEAHDRQANFDFASGKFFVAGKADFGACTICVRSDGRAGIQMDKSAFDFAESDNFFGPCPFNNSVGFPFTQPCGNQYLFLHPDPVTGALVSITTPPSPTSFPGTLQSQNLNFKQGRVQQFNLNIEHQLPGSVVLTVGYAGSRSSRILVDGLNLNVGSPTACGTVSGYTLGCGPGGTAFGPKWGNPPFPFPLTIANSNDVGRAHYDGLQIKAETKSVRHGLYALIGYTYSRTFDSGFADGLGTTPGATYFPLPGYQHADWALSQINLNHQLTASVTYHLPFGKGKQFGGDWSGPVNAVLGNWEVDVIEKITSGFPLFVVDGNRSGTNFQWNGNSLNRPNQICNPKSSHPTIKQWFNTNCFAEAPDGQLGNANRAPLYGPDFVNTDFSFIKHIPIGETVNVDFRAEFFNLFNHPQFYLPGDGTSMQNIDSPTLGVVFDTVNNPRLIQFALKVNF